MTAVPIDNVVIDTAFSIMHSQYEALNLSGIQISRTRSCGILRKAFRAAALSPFIRRTPSSTMECKLPNGDRAIFPQRETRKVSGRTNHHTESLVPFDPDLSAELWDNSKFWPEYSYIEDWLAERGEMNPRNPFEFTRVPGMRLNRARPPLRCETYQLTLSESAGFITCRSPPLTQFRSVVLRSRSPHEQISESVRDARARHFSPRRRLRPRATTR